MEYHKPKTIRNLEERMQQFDGDSFRHHVLESAKDFKTSWVELGRALYSVWKDKKFKEWGFTKFDTYTSKEIGIRKQTAMKLLKSYFFLEKEEPRYLQESFMAQADASKVPTYEAVDVLRMAKNKKTLDEADYGNLKKGIFEEGKDAGQLKKDLTSLIRNRDELEPEEAYKKRREVTVRRFLSTLKALKKEIELSKLLSSSIIKEAGHLIDKLESELS